MWAAQWRTCGHAFSCRCVTTVSRARQKRTRAVCTSPPFSCATTSCLPGACSSASPQVCFHISIYYILLVVHRRAVLLCSRVDLRFLSDAQNPSNVWPAKAKASFSLWWTSWPSLLKRKFATCVSQLLCTRLARVLYFTVVLPIQSTLCNMSIDCIVYS